MVTFPAHDIWDGTIIHSSKEIDSVIDALVSLTENLDAATTPDAHYLGVWAHSLQMPDVFITSILTHLDGDPNLKSTEKFMNIPGQQDSSKTSVAIKVAGFTMHSNRQ